MTPLQPKYKAYDLPHITPVAEQLTDAEASRFDDQGFFVIPQDARLKDYADEIRRHELSDHGEALRQIKGARNLKRIRKAIEDAVEEDKPNYRAIVQQVLNKGGTKRERKTA